MSAMDVVDVTGRILKILRRERYGLLVAQIQERDRELAKIPPQLLGQICAWTPGVARVNSSKPARWRLAR